VEPVLEAWREDEVPLQEYAAGTTGPEEWSMPQRPQR
jgi:glucose-6-phosphate 1-dehydrogenase